MNPVGVIVHIQTNQPRVWIGQNGDGKLIVTKCKCRKEARAIEEHIRGATVSEIPGRILPLTYFRFQRNGGS